APHGSIGGPAPRALRAGRGDLRGGWPRRLAVHHRRRRGRGGETGPRAGDGAAPADGLRGLLRRDRPARRPRPHRDGAEPHRGHRAGGGPRRLPGAVLDAAAAAELLRAADRGPHGADRRSGRAGRRSTGGRGGARRAALAAARASWSRSGRGGAPPGAPRPPAAAAPGQTRRPPPPPPPPAPPPAPRAAPAPPPRAEWRDGARPARAGAAR